MGLREPRQAFAVAAIERERRFKVFEIVGTRTTVSDVLEYLAGGMLAALADGPGVVED